MTERYARQTMLVEIGKAGQAKLAAARVLVVGAGGLGSTVIQGLAGAGVGNLAIVDHDVVEESNLHRQPLFSMAAIGNNKAECAAKWVRAYNPAVAVSAHRFRLDPANAPALLAGVDLVVDAADAIAVTYTLSDLCKARAMPMISASVIGMSGYAGGFCGGGADYRAVFPDLPQQGQTCASAGVLGPAVAVLGAIQAQMVLAVLLGLEPSPLGRMVTVDMKTWRFGGFSFASAKAPSDPVFAFIAASQLCRSDVVIELRSREEAPEPATADALRLPPDQLANWQPPANGRVVLCCRSGLRAWRGAKLLAKRGANNLVLLANG